MHDDVVARRVVVHGRVQGVFFRATTRDQARVHGVVGWVRNRADGTVEAWLEGRRRDVDAVLAWIHAGGPRHASVDRVEVEDAEVAGHRRFAVNR
ncbi:MAG: acylphosphatase [Nitriliruptoraceae bacterium]